MLTHIFAKEQPSAYLDTTIILKNGKGLFKSNKVLPKGLYSIYNNRRKFDILIGENQRFGIEADTTDFIHLNRFTSSPDNDAFYDFLRFDIPAQIKLRQLSEQYQNTVGDTEKKAISEQWQELSKERMGFIKNIVNENEGLYVSKFLKAMFVPLELPVMPPDDQYRWYRAHFFDNFNIYDPDLLRTPLYESKLTDYLTWFSRSHLPDTVCAELDRMLTKAKADKGVFQCVLATILNYFSSKTELIAHDNFVVHLVDNWYVPYADWANVEELKNFADKVRPTLIGKLAPPLEQLLVLPPDHIKAAALDTAIKNDIHVGAIIPDFRKSINSKYIAILFWDVSCSHCKSTIQGLWNVYETCKDKGLQVIALQTLRSKEGKAKWIDYLNEHGMYDWVNAWIIYDNKWHDIYIYDAGVPKIYLLNEKKEIILKGNLDPQEIQSRIEAFEGKNQE